MNVINNLAEDIFAQPDLDFEQKALEIFRLQYQYNIVYRNYVDALGIKPDVVQSVATIPFLPIRFFKTHKVVTTDFNPQLIFESSGTTATINSKHYVKDAVIYEKSFGHAFKKFYGNPADWCIIGLLPSYLERQNSSLVYMVNKLIKASRHVHSGFYLNEFSQLSDVLKLMETGKQKTLLIGVTFALLDFAMMHPMPLQYTTLMETGGMKGRRKEMIREEVHSLLKNAFGLAAIHSEYGMTELLSQAYSKGNGLFEAPRWMKILIRDEEDPLTIKTFTSGSVNGVVNIIDLANIYSCSFIATDDLGTLYPDGSFEIKGRMDNADLRGCSLLVV